MKAASKSQFSFTATNVPEAAKRELLQDTGPQWFLITLPQPHNQDGHDFSFVVAPFKFSDEMKAIQNGAGVLCQTEAEAKETFEILKERGKKHLVAVQAPGFGIVGWATNLRRVCNEIGVSLLRGKWLAFDREHDLDTLETKIIRRKETETQGEAEFWQRKWLDEYAQDKKAYFDSIGKSVTPLPPLRCNALTKTEIEDLGKTKEEALKRQWPRCFEIFERAKTNPDAKIPDQQIEDAYLLDLVSQGIDLWDATDGKKLRPDMELVLALGNAAKNYAKRGKSKITDTAIYLIAFTWELGWCYLPYEQLAEKLGEILETPFTPGQVKSYVHSLGLYTKHKSGPPENSP